MISGNPFIKKSGSLSGIIVLRWYDRCDEKHFVLQVGEKYHSTSIFLTKSEIRRLNLMRTGMYSALSLSSEHTCSMFCLLDDSVMKA